ncbi:MULTISPECIES: L,D-transpeptidase [unclassified Rhizobium]|uniref:L,D-transpeptidase n=1 Tax=unclassified Rhizobium TaxID=2613769 RepID=UPI00146B8108|nr:MULTISPECIES: L,D-transpeptidase [unclassified Rhizobium]MBD9449591.1 L,D-transpeptidase [Rhizobium sp. RHZ01]MBD9453984.1 L,D-transpeptidase [Rhizobium sp. RHZ02]NMN73482.1 lipoprotein-anchoring transpeptidase ErfK/SrfK [Rhizobium sp. 57MFTsu3.2]
MRWTRRDILLGGLASVGTLAAVEKPTLAAAASYFSGTSIDNGVTFRSTNFAKIDRKWHRQVVKYFSSEPIGTVVVDTTHHFLYLIMENKTAIRYGVGVGREGFKWYGRATIDQKALWPRWTPPPEMRQRHPELPESVDGGSPKNPLGPRAMYLLRDGVDTGYRFHGTLEPGSIGKDASSGCIRMFNEDAIDLYQRCPIGTAVQVLPHIADQAQNAAQTNQAVPVE